MFPLLLVVELLIGLHTYKDCSIVIFRPHRTHGTLTIVVDAHSVCLSVTRLKLAVARVARRVCGFIRCRLRQMPLASLSILPLSLKGSNYQ